MYKILRKEYNAFSLGDSVPKISTGKYFRNGERLMMPVSVTCHHGLMDGYHVAQFIEKLHL